MSRTRRLRILHRRGCHLCDDMLEAVERFCAGRAVRVELVDIDTDPDLRTQYDHEIPVLLAGEVEICRHRLDPARLGEWLSSG